MAAALLGAALAIIVAIAVKSAGVLRGHVRCRPAAGLFSNLVECIQTAMCHPQHEVLCVGWPPELAALMPQLPLATEGAVPDVEVATLGRSECYVMQDPRILEDPAFGGVRVRMHLLVAPGAAFAPAPFLLERARSWWDRAMRGARFVVGVHGRAVMHYETGIGLSTHTRLLAAEAEAAMPPGAHLLFASCNRTMAELMTQRFGTRVVWRQPEGAVTEGNTDWGTRLSADSAEGALVDAILLSMCDVVICGASNVVLYVAALNPAARIKIARHLKDVRSG
jgi:hypothetical protein